MDQKTYAHFFARRFETWRSFEFLIQFTSFVASWFSLSAAVFLRHNFGERYLGWMNLAFAYTVVVLFAGLGNAISSFTGNGTSTLMVLIWWAFILLGLAHRGVIWWNNRRGVQWHSYYVGTSWIPLRVSTETMLTWVEPGLVFVVGMVAKTFAPLVGIWLLLSAFALWLHAQLTFFRERQTVLDAIDAGLEARFMGAALSGRPAGDTAGVTIAESVARRVQGDPDIQALLTGLPAELKSIVNTPSTDDTAAAKSL